MNPIVRRHLAGPFPFRCRTSDALPRRALAFASALFLAGCASLSPDGGTADVQALVAGNPLMAGQPAQRMPDEASRKSVDALLARPLDAEAAVRIALVNGPRVQDAFATLQLSDADRVQAASLPNPVLSFSRLAQGRELELLHEQALAADLAQGAVEDLVAARGHAQQADRMAFFLQQRLHVLGLPQGQPAFARGNHDIAQNRPRKVHEQKPAGC